MISIRYPVDLAEVWADIRKGNKVVLWCNGLKGKPSSASNQLRKSDGDETNDDDDETSRRSRNDKNLCTRGERKR